MLEEGFNRMKSAACILGRTFHVNPEINLPPTGKNFRRDMRGSLTPRMSGSIKPKAACANFHSEKAGAKPFFDLNQQNGMRAGRRVRI
jgi:hypothetical protein